MRSWGFDLASGKWIGRRGGVCGVVVVLYDMVMFFFYSDDGLRLGYIRSKDGE